MNPPCVIFEDDHLLVVNKPAGMNTHAPGPFAGEGIYDWLRHREPRWGNLAILHRLDKETSGVMVFGKSPLANRSLTEQFTQRAVKKKYVLLTDRPVPPQGVSVETALQRAGEKYLATTLRAGSEKAVTHFTLLKDKAIPPGCHLVEAEPVTGRTHQIRVHAASRGFPVLGDALYGGSPFQRACLHARELTFQHPVTGTPVTFTASPDFLADPVLILREAIIDPGETDAFRVINGAADGFPGWYGERLGDWILFQSETPINSSQTEAGRELARKLSLRGGYHKQLDRQVRQSVKSQACPQLFWGEAAPQKFVVKENGLQFELSFQEGYSVGLFLDQRDNRRRFLTGHAAAGFPLFPRDEKGREVLNTFAYTCGFSVCAARGGARVTSLDLSKKHLDWGRRNFELNGLNAGEHEFIFGDTFDWLRRLTRKNRTFDAVVLDPPTFSQSKAGGTFRAEKDYGRLVAAALPLLKPDGVLLASTNAARLEPETFLKTIEQAIQRTGRKLVQHHYTPQPPDFRVSRAEPAYLKTVWLRIK